MDNSNYSFRYAGGFINLFHLFYSLAAVAGISPGEFAAVPPEVAVTTWFFASSL